MAFGVDSKNARIGYRYIDLIKQIYKKFEQEVPETLRRLKIQTKKFQKNQMTRPQTSAQFRKQRKNINAKNTTTYSYTVAVRKKDVQEPELKE